MQLMVFALGVFLFAAFTMLIFRYTTYLSNKKKGFDANQNLASEDAQQTLQ